MRTALFGISFLAVLGLTGTCLAQPAVPGGGAQQPRFGSYLPLLRNNGGAANLAGDVYGIMRPQQALSQQQGAFQQQLSQTNQSVNGIENADRVLVTGKGASFVNYSHYFNNFGTGSSGGSGSLSGRNTGQSATFGGTGTGSRGMGMSGTTIGQAPSNSGSQRR